MRLEKQAASLEVEVSCREKPVAPSVKTSVLAGAFPEQVAFCLDQSTQKFILSTRRAAKSMSVGLDMINDALQDEHAGANYVIVGLNRPDTKRNYWKDVFKKVNDQYNLDARFNTTELSMTLPNGSTIYLTGADASEKEKKKLLGGKNRKVAVDEAQDWDTDLEELVYKILKPSTIDWRGSIALIGTPSNKTHGFFARVTKGCRAGYVGPEKDREAGWHGHSWTTFENPYIREQWREEIAAMIAINPRVIEVPWFRQMYRGEWVIDLDKLCYRFNRERNLFTELPKYGQGQWRYVIAIDLGYSPDPSAIVICAYHDHDPALYLLESWKQWKMDITDVAAKVAQYELRYRLDTYIVDGANKQAVAEMRKRHGLPLMPADKTGKSDFIELMNSDFIMGKIKVHESATSQGLENHDRHNYKESLSLIEEWAGLIWDEKKLRELNRREEHSACPNHLADAALYGWRYCFPFLSQAIPPKVYERTPAWYAQEEERMRESAESEMIARKQFESPVLGLGEDGDLDPNLM